MYIRIVMWWLLIVCILCHVKQLCQSVDCKVWRNVSLLMSYYTFWVVLLLYIDSLHLHDQPNVFLVSLGRKAFTKRPGALSPMNRNHDRSLCKDCWNISLREALKLAGNRQQHSRRSVPATSYSDVLLPQDGLSVAPVVRSSRFLLAVEPLDDR